MDVNNDSMTRSSFRAYDAILKERIRAHEKHDKNGDSMERKEWDDFAAWLSVTGEEVGEVARVVCELRHGHITRDEALAKLDEEITQTLAMYTVWLTAVRQAIASPLSPTGRCRYVTDSYRSCLRPHGHEGAHCDLPPGTCPYHA